MQPALAYFSIRSGRMPSDANMTTLSAGRSCPPLAPAAPAPSATKAPNTTTPSTVNARRRENPLIVPLLLGFAEPEFCHGFPLNSRSNLQPRVRETTSGSGEVASLVDDPSALRRATVRRWTSTNGFRITPRRSPRRTSPGSPRCPRRRTAPSARGRCSPAPSRDGCSSCSCGRRGPNACSRSARSAATRRSRWPRASHPRGTSTRSSSIRSVLRWRNPTSIAARGPTRSRFTSGRRESRSPPCRGASTSSSWTPTRPATSTTTRPCCHGSPSAG